VSKVTRDNGSSDTKEGCDLTVKSSNTQDRWQRPVKRIADDNRLPQRQEVDQEKPVKLQGDALVSCSKNELAHQHEARAETHSEGEKDGDFERYHQIEENAR
jgi:hypothetical protein